MNKERRSADFTHTRTHIHQQKKAHTYICVYMYNTIYSIEWREEILQRERERVCLSAIQDVQLKVFIQIYIFSLHTAEEEEEEEERPPDAHT